jgi:hypothetical protein
MPVAHIQLCAFGSSTTTTIQSFFLNRVQRSHVGSVKVKYYIYLTMALDGIEQWTLYRVVFKNARPQGYSARDHSFYIFIQILSQN